MIIPPKVLHRFNAILIKTQFTFFKDFEQTLLKFMWNHKPLQIAKSIMRKNELGWYLIS